MKTVITRLMVIGWIGVLLAATHARASIRVAIYSQDNSATNSVSLAYPKLAQIDGIELVEREELNKVLQEQAISATGLIDTKQAIAFGKIAKANVLAVVEHNDPLAADSPIRGFVAFDATTGMRLCDTVLPQNEGEELADAIANDVRTSLAKLNTADHDRRILCLLSTRNVDLSPSTNGFCNGVAALLQRQLLNSPSVVILERERLGVLNQERRVADDIQIDNTLASSLVTLELDIARAGDSPTEAVLATLSLYDIHHHSLGVAHAKGTRNSAGDLASSLAAEVLKSLALSPIAQATPMDIRLEAARFERESRFRITHRDWKQAADAADSAFALMPSAPGLHILLARTLVMFGISQFSPQIDEDGFIVLGQRPPGPDLDSRLQILHRATGEMFSAGKLPTGCEQLAGAEKILRQFIVAVLQNNEGSLARADKDGLFSPPLFELTAKQKKELAEVIQDYRSYTVEVEEPQAKAAVHDANSFREYSAILLQVQSDDCHIFASCTNDYTAEVARRYPDWAKLAAKYATPQVTTYGPVEELIEGAAWSWCTVNHDWMSQWRPACFEKLNAVDAQNWQRAVDAIQQADAPTRLYINLQPWVTRLTAPQAPSRILVPTEIAPKAVEPPSVVSLLFSKEITLANVNAKGSDLCLLNKPTLLGNDLYSVALARNDDGTGEMRLLKMPTDGHEPLQVLSKLPVNADNLQQLSRDPNSFFQSPHFLGSTHCIICSDLNKIYVLPMDKSAGRVISATRELPGPYVQAAADLGNMLYLVITSSDSGAYLVSYDLKTGHTQTLVSSRRQERKSPFDNVAPMAVPFMVPDPPRDRIVFFAYHSQWNDAAKGLWEYSHRTGEFRKLRDTTYARKEDEGGYEICGSQVVENTFILDTGVEHLVYDLAADSPKEKVPPGLERFRHSFYEPEVFKGWWHKYGNPGGSGVGYGDNTIERRIGDVHAFSELWQGAYPSFADDMPDGHLLVGDGTGLWLLTPR